MITGKNKSKILKDMSYKCECILDGKTVIQISYNKCLCECKKRVCEKYYIWNSATCNCHNGNYLASIMHNSGITCNEIIDVDVGTKLSDKVKLNDEKEKYFQQIPMKKM